MKFRFRRPSDFCASPDDTQEEVSAVSDCCPQAVSKAYKRLGITRKKTLRYKEQNPEKVKEYQEKIKDIPKREIAYVYETGINSYLYCEYGYAPHRQKVYDKVSGRKFQITNIAAAKLENKIIVPT